MKVLLIIFCLIVTSNIVNAQHAYIPYVKPNKYWFYSVHGFQEPAPKNENAYALWTKNDTIIGGKEYLNVYRSYLEGTHPCQFPPCFSPVIPYIFLDTINMGFIREDTSQRLVYYLPALLSATPCANEERIIYDFNMMMDDTISKCYRLQLGWEDPWWGPYGAIDTIVNENIYGQERKSWSFMEVYLNGMPNLGYSKIIEGVGMTHYDAINFAQNHIFSDFCEGDLFHCHIASSTKSTGTSELKLFPNPTN